MQFGGQRSCGRFRLLFSLEYVWFSFCESEFCEGPLVPPSQTNFSLAPSFVALSCQPGSMHPVVLLQLRGGAAPLVSSPGAGLALGSLLMKNMIGAGIFALFTALTSSNTGLLPGLAILAIVATASTLSFELLGEATASSHGEVATTEQLWQEAVGRGACLIGAATFLQGFGALVQFSATCTDLLVTFAPRVSRSVLTMAAGIVLVPLCLANELSALRYSSAVGLIGVLYSVLFVCWRAADGSYAAGGRWHLATRVASPLLRCDWRSLEFVGIMNTACFAHLNVPAYWQAWRRLHPSTDSPKELLRGFRRVVRISFALAALLYVAITVAASRTFGGGADSRLLLMRYAADDRGAVLMRAATLVSVIGGYPLIFQAIRDMACTRLLRPAASLASRRALSLALLGSLVSCALVVDNVAKFMSLRGAFLGALLVYSMPTAIALASLRKRGGDGDGGTLGRRALLALCAYGAVSSIAGTAAVLRS